MARAAESPLELAEGLAGELAAHCDALEARVAEALRSRGNDTPLASAADELRRALNAYAAARTPAAPTVASGAAASSEAMDLLTGHVSGNESGLLSSGSDTRHAPLLPPPRGIATGDLMGEFGPVRDEKRSHGAMSPPDPFEGL